MKPQNYVVIEDNELVGTIQNSDGCIMYQYPRGQASDYHTTLDLNHKEDFALLSWKHGMGEGKLEIPISEITSLCMLLVVETEAYLEQVKLLRCNSMVKFDKEEG
jgi:hypothetical protein